MYALLVECFSILDLYYEDQRKDPYSPFHPVAVEGVSSVETMDITTLDDIDKRDPSVWECCSIGSGLALAEYALMVHHQAQPNRTKRLCFHLIDPTPVSWQHGSNTRTFKYPQLQPRFPTVNDIPDAQRVAYRDVMLLNYPDGRPFDLEALVWAKPKFVLPLLEMSGAAGSAALHQLVHVAGGKTNAEVVTKATTGSTQERKHSQKCAQAIAMMSQMGIAYEAIHTTQIVNRQRNPRVPDLFLVQNNALHVLILRGLIKKLRPACRLDTVSSSEPSGINKVNRTPPGRAHLDALVPLPARHQQIASHFCKFRTMSSVDDACREWDFARTMANNLAYQAQVAKQDPACANADSAYWKQVGYTS